MSWLLVAFGGALGATSRFGLTKVMNFFLGDDFPYATITANILGSFVIGLLWIWLIQQQWGSEYYRYLWIVGFLGAFTTFSSFSLESITLLQQERLLAFAGYVGGSVICCLLATLAGIWCAKHI